MTKKYDEPPPPFRTSAYDDYEKVDYYHDTKI